MGSTDDLLVRLKSRGPRQAILAGFDFPIGVPETYARRAGISRFLVALQSFGTGAWSRFYDVAETADENRIIQ